MLRLVFENIWPLDVNSTFEIFLQNGVFSDFSTKIETWKSPWRESSRVPRLDANERYWPNFFTVSGNLLGTAGQRPFLAFENYVLVHFDTVRWQHRLFLTLGKFHFRSLPSRRLNVLIWGFESSAFKSSNENQNKNKLFSQSFFQWRIHKKTVNVWTNGNICVQWFCKNVMVKASNQSFQSWKIQKKWWQMR